MYSKWSGLTLVLGLACSILTFGSLSYQEEDFPATQSWNKFRLDTLDVQRVPPVYHHLVHMSIHLSILKRGEGGLPSNIPNIHSIGSLLLAHGRPGGFMRECLYNFYNHGFNFPVLYHPTVALFLSFLFNFNVSEPEPGDRPVVNTSVIWPLTLEVGGLGVGGF